MFFLFFFAEGSSTKSPPKTRAKKLPDISRNLCLIPDDGLPPVVLATGSKGGESCSFKEFYIVVIVSGIERLGGPRGEKQTMAVTQT